MELVTILMAVSTLVVILFPLVFALIVRKKTGGVFWVFLLGLAGFAAANYGLNWLIDFVTGDAINKLPESQETLSAILCDLQQSFVEELMRFLLILLCMKNCLYKENSLMYAAGHGGLEMMLRGGEMAAGVITAFTKPAESPYLGMPIFSPFLFPILHGFVFCLHIGLSYLVYKGVKERKYLLVFLAFVLHFVANCSTKLEVPLLPLLGPVAVVVGLLIFTVRSYKREDSFL